MGQEAMVEDVGLKGNEYGIKFLIHTSFAGKVIGKGGEEIKKLRAEVDAEVKIPKENIPNTTDRVITVTGSKDNVADCIRTILQRLDGEEVRGEDRRVEEVTP